MQHILSSGHECIIHKNHIYVLIGSKFEIYREFEPGTIIAMNRNGDILTTKNLKNYLLNDEPLPREQATYLFDSTYCTIDNKIKFFDIKTRELIHVINHALFLFPIATLDHLVYHIGSITDIHIFDVNEFVEVDILYETALMSINITSDKDKYKIFKPNDDRIYGPDRCYYTSGGEVHYIFKDPVVYLNSYYGHTTGLPSIIFDKESTMHFSGPYAILSDCHIINGDNYVFKKIGCDNINIYLITSVGNKTKSAVAKFD